jgi:hypothetical protein
MKALSLLEAYESYQQQAQTAWKKCLWNITKAKRSKGTNVLGAQNAREELRPRCLLLCGETPQLIAEDASSVALTQSPSSSYFHLIDPVTEAKKKNKKGSSDSSHIDNDNNANATTSSTGLRNRKGRELESKEHNKWTKDESVVEEEEDDEEAKLSAIDTVQLFGLPTKELRQAKEEATRALNLYVQAANMLIELSQNKVK